MPKKIKFKMVKVRQQSKKTLALIIGMTFTIAMLFSYIFEVLLADVPLLIAFLMLIGIIIIGIFLMELVML